MKKLSNYIQFGKGRGFRFVFLMSILLSALYGVVIGYAGLQLAKSPVVEDFIDSVPTFSVVDGVAQDRTIRWRSTIPLTEMPFTVDTTQEELSLPVADGIYVTANYIYYVSNYGTKVTRSVIEGSFDVSKEHLNKRVRLYVLSSAVGLTIISSIVSIIFFLVLTAISTIFGLILGIKLGGGRVWRSSAILWMFGQILNLVAGLLYLGTYASISIFAVCIIFNLIWLRRLQH